MSTCTNLVRARRALAVGVAALAAACGDARDERPPAAAAAAPAAATPAPTPAPRAAPAAAPVAAPAAAPPDPADSCRWKATGAVQLDTVGRGGKTAVTTSHWEPPVGDGMSMWSGHAGAQINCLGEGGSVSFGIQADEGAFAMQPRRYEIREPKYPARREVAVLGTIRDHSVMRATGFIELTEYDGHHIAGRFEITAHLLPGDGTATVTGEFAFKCPGLRGCAR